MKRTPLTILLTAALLLPLGLGGCSQSETLQGEPVRQAPEGVRCQAVYPEMSPYPDESQFFGKDGSFDSEGFDKLYTPWWEAQRAKLNADAGDLSAFLSQSLPAFLAGHEGENGVYSPVNVYLALAMLAETTGGDTQAQVLSLLGSEDLEALRAAAQALWDVYYNDDGAVTTVLASSLWLSEGLTYVSKTLDTLAEVYYASTFQGVMGSDEFNKALQTWVNDQTGGLLEEQAGNLTLDPSTVLALATTVYYKAPWEDEFFAANTQEGVFRSPDGEVTCDFMHQSNTNSYFWADKFSAVGKSLRHYSTMWFILPDEGVTPEELLRDETLYGFLKSGGEWDQREYLIVNLALPKFDVSSSLDLQDGLQALGIRDAFDAEVSDFTPVLQDSQGIALSQAQHAARVTVDEEGCTAAAFTVMADASAAMPPEEEVDFTLDRPFLFVITNGNQLPLFVGVVNTPV